MDAVQETTATPPSTRLFGRVRKRFQSLGNRALGICAATVLVTCLLEVLHLPPFHPQLSDADLRLQDHFVLLRNYLYPNGNWKTDAINDVVLISIDRDSATRLKIDDLHQVPKEVFARLVAKLRDAKAAVVALDVPLDADSPSVVRPSVDPLVKELSTAKNVILTSGIDSPGGNDSQNKSLVLLRSPSAAFVEAVGEDSGSVGNNVLVADPDGLVRHGTMLFDQLGPSFYKAVSLRIFEKKIGTMAVVDDHGKIYLRDHLLPKSVRINYAGAPGTFKTIPIWRALEWEKHAEHGLFGTNAIASSANVVDANNSSRVVDANNPLSVANNHASEVDASNPSSVIDANNPFKNKVVLIGVFDGVSSSGVSGNHSYGNFLTGFLTPAAPPPTPMSRVEIQANLVSNLLHKNFLSESDEWEILLFMVFAGLLSGRILGRLASRPWISAVVVTLVSALWTLMAFFAFVGLGILIPVVVPLIGVALPATSIVLWDQHYKIKREKAKQTKLFRSLAAKPLANEIERKLLAELGLTGKIMDVTIAACQLHDFSLEQKSSSPEQILQRLNQCLGVMMTTIGEHGGLVERVWNCGVIGLWGAPIAMDSTAQAEAAARCMRDMRSRLKQLAGSNENGSRTPFGLTCGINSGEAICGTIDAGSKDSSLVQYGALGPAVDLAMQLDSLNVEYGTTCILGSSTAKLLEGKSEVREIDSVPVGSPKSNQSVFEFLSVDGNLPGVFEEAMELFRQGRTAYSDGRFREAHQLFSTCFSMVPEDKATAMMLDRCRSILEKSEAKHP